MQGGTENEIFNLGADQPHTILEMAELISKAMGISPNIEFAPARSEVKHAYSDHSKANKIFKIKDLVELKEGVNEMVAWVKEKGPMKSKKFSNIEIDKNMPPSWRKIM